MREEIIEMQMAGTSPAMTLEGCEEN